jgi:glycosyltransferase involved in cell wall biosynthesis
LSVHSVGIVLSSFNGAGYVAEQVESIRRQTFADWVLLVRDDGSSDETRAIIERAAARDSRIVLLGDELGNLGSVRSFATALEHALGLGLSYVALADQDDVWYPDKIERQLARLRSRERERGEHVPLLTHSDLAVVSADLALIHPSFRRFQRLGEHPAQPLRKLLVQNYVTGCATMVNRALLEAALPVPDVPVHDWWLALCAGAFGEVLYDPVPTLAYRQHAGNLLGARGWRRVYRESVLHPFGWWDRGAGYFTAALEQAGELLRRVEAWTSMGLEPPACLPMLRDYCSAFGPERAVVARLSAVRRNHIRPSSLLPVPLAFYARVLLSPGLSRRAESTPVAAPAFS